MIIFFSERAARAGGGEGGGGGGRGQTFFFFFFPCSADHERDWPPCKVVYFGLATNELNVRNNNNNKQQQQLSPVLPKIDRVLPIIATLLSSHPFLAIICSIFCSFMLLSGGLLDYSNRSKQVTWRLTKFSHFS